MKRRWLSNSMANLVAGGSAALFNFAVPAILARHLLAMEFSLWGLALQIVAYLYLFGLGIQTAIAKYIAEGQEKADREDQLKTVSAAGTLISAGVLLGLLAVALVVIFYPLLFPGLPPELLPAFRWALLAVGASTVLQLTSLLPIGIFTGLYQSFHFVACQVLVRVGTVLALWWGVNHGAGFVTLALIYSCLGLLLLPTLFGLLVLTQRWTLQGLRWPEKARLVSLFKYCMGLSVWIFSMLLVTSVSTILVGRFDIAMAGSYSLALTFNAVIGGILNSLLSPLIPMGSAVQANAAAGKVLPELLTKVTFWCALGLLLFLLAVLLLGMPMLGIWVGEGYAAATYPVLLVLVLGNVLRNLAMPYAIFLLSTALHRKAALSALVEGGVNVLASIVLGYRWGVIGVAGGTVAGAVAGLLMHVFYNFGRTPEITPDRGRYLWRGVGRPLLFALPLYVPVLFFL